MYRILMCLTFLLAAGPVQGQLVMDSSYDARQLVEEVLLGNRLKVANPRIRGQKGTYGKFEDQSSKPIIGQGVVFSTGSIFDLPGPNRRASTGRNMNGQGDKALFYLADGPTYDAAGIEFDFIAEYENFVFNYYFGSEEYTEYVNSQFNDVFAFFITGPGYSRNTNLAVVPGRKTPITINTIHPGKNTDFYIDNNVFNSRGYRLVEKEAKVDSVWSGNLELDGFTKLMQIEAQVQPGEKYHIKIVVADVNDGAYDSAVFLEGKSFTSLPSDPIERAEIERRESSQFVRAYEPGVLGQKRPRPGPVLLQLQAATAQSIEVDRPAPDTLPSDTATTTASDFELALVVEFGLDSDVLDAASRQALDQVLEQIRGEEGRSLLLEGHTCDLGNRAYNLRLSRRRAVAVRQYFLDRGVAPDRIQIRAEAFAVPRAPNTAEANRALNRRVELRWAD